MPLNGKHQHSQKWHDLWMKLQAQGHTPESAAAIATSALEGKGDVREDSERRVILSSRWRLPISWA
jgi:hypothetical protein